MERVVVTGSASPLGRRVIARLVETGRCEVIGVDLRPDTGGPAEARAMDLVTADLGPVFGTADVVVHLASAFGPVIDGPETEANLDVVMTRRVLEASTAASSLVVLSTAAVYGPWPNNAVPLTEDAPLRPHPGLGYAVQRAEIERLAAEWAADHPETVVTRLRPAPVVHQGQGSWLARSLRAAATVPTGDDVPAQYLHVDDLAAAVLSVLEARLGGPVNVAPDGWLTPSERRALSPTPRLRLPEPAALKLASWRWRLGLAPVLPGILPYARHPWVVANDRLAATGWTATNSNEEAYVAGHEASPIEKVSPRRRQELALGVAGGLLAAAAGGVVVLTRRQRRRRR